MRAVKNCRFNGQGRAARGARRVCGRALDARGSLPLRLFSVARVQTPFPRARRRAQKSSSCLVGGELACGSGSAPGRESHSRTDESSRTYLSGIGTQMFLTSPPRPRMRTSILPYQVSGSLLTVSGVSTGSAGGGVRWSCPHICTTGWREHGVRQHARNQRSIACDSTHRTGGERVRCGGRAACPTRLASRSGNGPQLHLADARPSVHR